jgi:hypothetical protein
LIAEAVRESTTAIAGVDGKKELAVEAIARYQRDFEEIAEYFRPLSSRPSHANWKRYPEWAGKALEAAKVLAQYQSPKLAAVAVAPPPVEETTRRFMLTVFSNQEPLPPPEPPEAS